MTGKRDKHSAQGRSRGGAIRWWERVRVFLLFSAALLTVELGRGVYQWFAYAEERAEIRRLSPQVDEAGVAVVASHLRVDSLRQRIEAMDSSLERARHRFRRFGGGDGGRMTSAAYSAYRREVSRYNDRVAERNGWITQWQRAVNDNRAAVDRYNLLAERIRGVATRMGELHYNIPSPAEAATRGGLGR